MGNKKSGSAPISQRASTANPNSSSTTHSQNTSALLKSSFAPSRFQLSLFASVIQGLESDHLRIHTTAGKLRCDHSLGSRVSVTCLDWGHYHSGNQYDPSSQDFNRKRKRHDLSNGNSKNGDPSNFVLAYGTSQSDVQFFSPHEAKIVGSLTGGHTGGIQAFKFVDDGEHDLAWSSGGDGKLIQWNTKKAKILRNVSISSGPANTLCPTGNSVLYASHNVYNLQTDDRSSTQHYNASTNAVHTILSQNRRIGSPLRFLSAANIDHFITVFQEDEMTQIGNLRTDNEIVSMDYLSTHGDETSSDGESEARGTDAEDTELIAAVNRDGVLELFENPFAFSSPSSNNGTPSLKARIKQRTRRAFAQIELTNPSKTTKPVRLPVVNVSIEENDLVLAWVEGGVKVNFERVRWQDQGTKTRLLHGVVNISKSSRGDGMEATIMNGVKDVGKVQVDDSQAVVTNGVDSDSGQEEEEGQNVQEEEDDDDENVETSSAEDESESEAEEDENAALPPEAKGLNGMREVVEASGDDDDDDDIDMPDVGEGSALEKVQKNVADEEDGDDDSPDEPPSFGDLLKASAPSTAIDVSTALIDSTSIAAQHSLVPDPQDPLSSSLLPTGASLSTVLTQSLRTNDTALLESCFHSSDLSLVRTTIERLESHLASALLQKLAERLHSRPGRAGSLMVWIQWTLVAHGGYLAGQGDVMRQLRSLHKVVQERASGLQELLALKGKLDMLEAQMSLRKSKMKTRARRGNENYEEEDDEQIVYVEGEESEEMEDDDEDDDDDLDSDVSAEDSAGDKGEARAKAKTSTGKSRQSSKYQTTSRSKSKAKPAKSLLNGATSAASGSDSDSDSKIDAASNSDLESEEEEEYDESEDDNRLIDDEASSTSNDSGDNDDEVDHQDRDTDSSADEDEEEDDGADDDNEDEDEKRDEKPQQVAAASLLKKLQNPQTLVSSPESVQQKPVKKKVKTKSS